MCVLKTLILPEFRISGSHTSTLKKEAVCSSQTTKLHGLTTPKTTIFIITSVKISRAINNIFYTIFSSSEIPVENPTENIDSSHF
jgi:hypothetical protein